MGIQPEQLEQVQFYASAVGVAVLTVIVVMAAVWLFNRLPD